MPPASFGMGISSRAPWFDVKGCGLWEVSDRFVNFSDLFGLSGKRSKLLFSDSLLQSKLSSDEELHRFWIALSLILKALHFNNFCCKTIWI